jgi:hypothetical protein
LKSIELLLKWVYEFTLPIFTLSIYGMALY